MPEPLTLVLLLIAGLSVTALGVGWLCQQIEDDQRRQQNYCDWCLQDLESKQAHCARCGQPAAGTP